MLRAGAARLAAGVPVRTIFNRDALKAQYDSAQSEKIHEFLYYGNYINDDPTLSDEKKQEILSQKMGEVQEF